MITAKKPYPSSMCYDSLVHQITDEERADGTYSLPQELCGYTLINGNLVPETFIQHVADQMDGVVFEYGYVLSEAKIFKNEFLDSLDELERSVLMQVVLQLMARDEFPVNLIMIKDKEEAA